MIKFFYTPGPNPAKVAMFLEETGMPYEVIPVDTKKGEQLKPEFLAVNPNAKLPVIVDGDATVFDSNAILLYLAEKTGKLLPASTPATRGDLLSWLMFIASGVGPYAGQAAFFRHQQPDQTYAINRYLYEGERHFGILDARLAKRRYLVGDAYSIVDIASWGWTRVLPRLIGDDAWKTFPNLKRHHDEINSRPAAARAEAIKDKYPFKAEMDEEARRFMYRHDLKP